MNIVVNPYFVFEVYMLEHLQKRIADTLSPTDAATLSTCGPLGIQAGRFPCQFLRIHPDQMRVYLLVPKTLDILENLIANPEVCVTASLWQAHGMARVLTHVEGMEGLHLLNNPHSRWSSLVEFQPRSVQLQPYADWEDEATIDFD